MVDTPNFSFLSNKMGGVPTSKSSLEDLEKNLKSLEKNLEDALKKSEKNLELKLIKNIEVVQGILPMVQNFGTSNGQNMDLIIPKKLSFKKGEKLAQFLKIVNKNRKLLEWNRLRKLASEFCIYLATPKDKKEAEYEKMFFYAWVIVSACFIYTLQKKIEKMSSDVYLKQLRDNLKRWKVAMVDLANSIYKPDYRMTISQRCFGAVGFTIEKTIVLRAKVLDGRLKYSEEQEETDESQEDEQGALASSKDNNPDNKREDFKRQEPPPDPRNTVVGQMKEMLGMLGTTGAGSGPANLALFGASNLPPPPTGLNEGNQGQGSGLQDGDDQGQSKGSGGKSNDKQNPNIKLDDERDFDDDDDEDKRKKRDADKDENERKEFEEILKKLDINVLYTLARLVILAWKRELPPTLIREMVKNVLQLKKDLRRFVNTFSDKSRENLSKKVPAKFASQAMEYVNNVSRYIFFKMEEKDILRIIDVANLVEKEITAKISNDKALNIPEEVLENVLTLNFNKISKKNLSDLCNGGKSEEIKKLILYFIQSFNVPTLKNMSEPMRDEVGDDNLELFRQSLILKVQTLSDVEILRYANDNKNREKRAYISKAEKGEKKSKDSKDANEPENEKSGTVDSVTNSDKKSTENLKESSAVKQNKTNKESQNVEQNSKQQPTVAKQSSKEPEENLDKTNTGQIPEKDADREKNSESENLTNKSEQSNSNKITKEEAISQIKMQIKHNNDKIAELENTSGQNAYNAR